MSDERYRAVGRALRRLSAMESLAAAGAEEMYGIVHSVCDRLNQENSADAPILALSPAQFTSDFWSITFRGREVFDFSVTPGTAPAVPGAVARCTVGPHYEFPPLHKTDLAVFHYIKVNDHGRWEQISHDLSEGVPVDHAMILDLIGSFAIEGLKHYRQR